MVLELGHLRWGRPINQGSNILLVDDDPAFRQAANLE
jgi:hypothetical protein